MLEIEERWKSSLERVSWLWIWEFNKVVEWNTGGSSGDYKKGNERVNIIGIWIINLLAMYEMPYKDLPYDHVYFYFEWFSKCDYLELLGHVNR